MRAITHTYGIDAWISWDQNSRSAANDDNLLRRIATSTRAATIDRHSGNGR
jgi:hypothetical protein